MKTQKFGIEIEMTGLTRAEGAEVIAKYFGTTSEYAGLGYDAYTVKETLTLVMKQQSFFVTAKALRKI